jgi:septal ring factor EnvC (AmiA/AmiB activator)
MDQTVPQPIDNMTGFIIRLNNVEQEIKRVQTQLNLYVPASVNDLQLQSIRSSVDRIEHDVTDMRGQLTDLNNKLAKQEQDAQKRDAEQRESQSSLQIRVLVGILAAAGTVIGGILINYFTHFIR